MQVAVEFLGKDALSGPANVAGAALSGLEKTAGIVGGALGGLEKGAIAVGTALTAMAAAVTAAVTVGVMEAGKLQQAVANISSIKPTINTDAVFSSLNLMQTRVAQSAKVMGDALYDVFSSIEVSGRQGLALVEKFSKGAIASITDAKTFGTAIMGELNAFKLGVEETDHLMDIFFNTVKIGVVTGQELAQNLGLVTQSAKMAGVSVEELGGLIAGVTKEGGPAAQSINNLNNLLLKLNTKESSKEFKELGIQTVDSTGKLRGVIPVLTDLRDHLDTYTEAGRLAAMQRIFPDLQARAGAAVIMGELDTVNRAIEENVTKTGAAGEAYEKMSATFQTQTTLLKQTFDSILTSVGSGVLPVLTSVTSGVQRFAADTAPLWDGWQNRLKAAFKTGGFQAWLTEVGNVAGELGKEIEKWIPQFTGWVGTAQTELGTALKKVYDETIVPWVTGKAEELKTKFETVWVPNLISWWNSSETQGKITGAMKEFGDFVTKWAAPEGAGGQMFTKIGTALGTAVLGGVSAEFAKINTMLTDLETTLRTYDNALGGVIKAGSGNAGLPGGGSSITLPRLPTLPEGATTSGPSPSPTQTSTLSGSMVPNQFGPDQELTTAQAKAACGPAAAVAFARAYGRNPTLREAVQLAGTIGAWSTAGMKGPDSEVNLLGAMGIPSHTEAGVNWAKVQASVVSGTPVILDTPEHYFAVMGYNAESGKFDLGASGSAIPGGSSQMTAAQIQASWAGPVRTSIYPNDPVGLVGPPSPAVPGPVDTSSAQAFMASIMPYAQAASAQNGLPANIMAAIAANETGYGQFAGGNNYFGIKGANPQTGASFNSPTWEVVNGQRVNTTAQFRAYDSPTESFADFGRFLQDNPRYAAALQYKDDPEAFIRAVHAAGYATDPNWSNQILKIASSASPTRGQTLSVPGLTPEQMAALTGGVPGDEDVDPNTPAAKEPGTINPYALTQEKLDAAFGGAEAEAAAGTRGRAILKAFGDAVEGEKPHALETLAGTMADLKLALLNDPQLSPEEALARYGEVMASVNTALLDGGEEAVATARTKITELEQTLSLDKIQAAAEKKQAEINRKADQAEKDALAQTARAVASMTTSREAAIADRDAEQAESERIAKAVEGAKLYVKAQEDQLSAIIDLQKQERSFQQERAALDLKYLEDLALIQNKKRGTDMSGVMASTAHTDPQAALNQELRDKVAAHNVDVFNLNQQQQIKAANHKQDVDWKLEETALASTLKATILDPTAETAKTTMNNWKDAYDYTVRIPREAALKWTETEATIGRIKTEQSNALGQLAIDTDLAKTRITSLTEPTGLPAVKTAADETFSQAVKDTDQILQNIIAINAAQGNAAGVTTGTASGTNNGSTGGGDPKNPTPGGPGQPPKDDDFIGAALLGFGSEAFGGVGSYNEPPVRAGVRVTGIDRTGGGTLNRLTDAMRDAMANGMIQAADAAAAANPRVNALTKILDPMAFNTLQQLDLKPPPAAEPWPVYVMNPAMGLGASGMLSGLPGGYGGGFPTGGGFGGLGGSGMITGLPGGYHTAMSLPSGGGGESYGSGGGVEPIDYDRLAAAMSRLTVQVDRQTLGRVVRTDQRQYSQSNLSNGVGGI